MSDRQKGDEILDKKRKIWLACIVMVIFCGFLVLYMGQKKKEEPITATDFKLNTVVKITIYDSKDTKTLEGAMELYDKYEKIFSRTDPDSELYRLNAGTLPQEDGYYILSDECAEVIKTGLFYSNLTHGAFDITVEPLSSLWDFTSEEKAVPSKEALEEASHHVGYEKVELDGNRIRFAEEGMALELGGIAKGYIADEIKKYLVERGVNRAIIDLGGNVLCVGEKENGKPFHIGIQKPFADRNETIGTIEVSDDSVVSSGIYERCFEKDGTFYHHILNPENGYPYENDLVSVTIISEKSMDADALSTSCFALGLETGLNLANNYPNTQAIFVTKDGKMHFTENFEEKIPITYVK